MLSPVDALLKLREEAVATRRRLADQMESILSAQAEIEAIDRAIADERAIHEAEESSREPRATMLAARPGFGLASDADEA